jgi:hypothetical protein
MSERKRIVEAEVVRKPEGAENVSAGRFVGGRWVSRTYVVQGDPEMTARIIRRARLRFGIAALVSFGGALLLGWAAATTEYVLLAALFLLLSAGALLLGILLAAIWRVLRRLPTQ